MTTYYKTHISRSIDKQCEGRILLGSIPGRQPTKYNQMPNVVPDKDPPTIKSVHNSSSRLKLREKYVTFRVWFRIPFI